jgi:LacI family transcriptional regulator
MSRMPVQNAIAERLQLSQSTVSRALRNKPGIRADIRAKVLEMASEMGYMLPFLEQTPAEGNGHFIGVLVHTPNQEWRRAAYLVGMSSVAAGLNATLVLQHVGTSDCEQILSAANQPPVMRNGLMRGLVLIFRWPDDVVRELAQRFTCVSLQHEYLGVPMDTIGVNSQQGTLDLMGHLHGLGHRRIGFLGRCPDLSWARGRFAGYVNALSALGLDYDPNLVVNVDVAELEAYERPGDPWKPMVDRVAAQVSSGVRAWMTVSDYAGQHLARGLLNRGLRIPHDVSITGFDAQQDDPTIPQLTSVSVPHEVMGAAGLKLLIDRLNGARDLPSCSMFPCPLRPGNSTGPLRAVEHSS